MFLYQEVWVSIPREVDLCIILEKKLTRDLWHGARSTVNNRSHRAAHGNIIRRKS
ncbi:hypothetical protein Bca4012_077823 [Brassica carinata]